MSQGSTTTKVTATDLDVRDLSSVSDSVSAVQSGTWNVTNISGTVSLPTGAATSAKQDTIITHLDGVEGLLTTIDADTGTLAGAVSGTEVQVDVVGSLPAGTNAIGKLASNSGVDIGDVDVTSVIPGTGATNLGKAIDTATGATDTGVLTLATRDDALSTLTPAEGDNVQLRTDSTGALWVKNSGTVTVDGSAVTQPVSNAGLTELAAAINSNKVDVNIVSSDVATGGTSAIDDADFTATVTSGTPAMGVYESTPTSVTDGDLGVVGITAGRRLKTSATIDTALPAGTNAIGKLSANSGVDIGDVDVTSISAGDNTIGRFKITDGTDVADVLDLTNSNPVAVALVDTNGDQISSFGGGTQYTEDAAAAANPVGTALMLVREDGRAGSLTSADGDNVAARGNNKGELYVKTTDSDALLTTIDADTSNISTKIDTIAGAVSGTEMQVDVVSGSIGITQGGNTASVDTAGVDDESNTSTRLNVRSMPSWFDGTTWDRARGNSVDGLLVNLGANNDVTASQSGTWNVTNISGTVSLPTGASTLAEQQSQTTHLATIAGDTTAIETAVQLIDDTVYTDGTGTVTKGIAILGQDGTNPQAIKTDSNGELQIDVVGALPAGTNNIGDVDILSIAAGDNNIGNVDVVTVPSDPFGANADAAATAGSTGTMQAKFRLMTSQLDSIKTAVETLDNTVGGSELQVDIVGSLPAGTNGIGKLTANSGVDIGDVDVTSVIAGTGATNLGKAEDAGHTTGDTGVFALGVRNDTPNTATTNTDADYSQISTDRVGGVRTALYETDFAVLGTNHVKKYYTNAGAVTDGIVWSPAAGKRWYVTDLIINVSAACTVTLEDDKAGGDEAVMKFEFAANSGAMHSFNTPLFSGEDAADLLVTTTAGNVYITVTGYEV